MTLTTLAYAAHVAHLDPFTGIGVLVLPPPSHDVDLGQWSLHAADWQGALGDLDRLGWEPAEAESGGLDVVAESPEGRTVVALYGRHPIISDPSLAEIGEASARLAQEMRVGRHL